MKRMVKYLGVWLLAVLFTTAFTNNVQAQKIAEDATWPNDWAVVWVVYMNGNVTTAAIDRASAVEAWEEVSTLIGKMTNNPNAVITPEYLMYRSGAVAFGAPAAFYSTKEIQDSIREGGKRTPEQREKDKQEEERRDQSMKANPWVTLIQPKTKEEVSCYAIGMPDGKNPIGCGDVFQGGLQNNEMGCYQNKTYVKCHLQCQEKFSGKKLEYKEGPCPAGRTANPNAGDPDLP